MCKGQKYPVLILFLGAGKTFTMLGTDKEPGIMALALNDLFFEMDKTKEDMKYKVSMSYLEVSGLLLKVTLCPIVLLTVVQVCDDKLQLYQVHEALSQFASKHPASSTTRNTETKIKKSFLFA